LTSADSVGLACRWRRPKLDSASFRKGLRDSVVILFAVGAFGVAYGVLAVDGGFSPLLTTGSSVLMVSGAAAMASLVGVGFGE